MYLWKTGLLAKDLRENRITEPEKMKYYFVSSLISFISMAMLRFTPQQSSTWVPVYFVAGIIITFFGVRITFRTNRGADGSDYITRMFCLSLPLLIKMNSILTVILMLMILGGMVLSNEVLTRITAMAILISPNILLALLYWRINVQLRSINA